MMNLILSELDILLGDIMELIINGWIDRDFDYNIRISETRFDDCLAKKIMNYFDYQYIDEGLGEKKTVIENANLRIWFSDEKCTLEEAQMNFDSFMETGELLTEGYYVGYSEWTITGFEIKELRIGGHDLTRELTNHIGQYAHLILTD